MKIKHDYVGDNLSRKDLANKYVTFLNMLEGNYTIALDAPWGSGKTKFIEFMSEEFNSENGKTKDVFIIYNAWENDYTDDPFMSLMSNFFFQIKDKQYIREDELKGLMEKSFLACKIIGKGIIKGGIKKILDSHEVESTITGVEDVISDTSNELFSKFFNNVEENKKTREDFTKELETTVKKILEERGKDKFIIVIDELDRCKPTFAIELLENIKHLFSINEIVFFIAIDKVQLSESIKAVYGSGFDSFTYLHRFFDLEVHLPKANLLGHFEIILGNKLGRGGITSCKNFLNEAIVLFDLTIRDFERIVSETILLKAFNELNYSDIGICLLLLILRYKEPEVYDVIFENRNILFSKIQHKITEERNSQNIDSFLITNAGILREYYTDNDYKISRETKIILELIENIL